MYVHDVQLSLLFCMTWHLGGMAPSLPSPLPLNLPLVIRRGIRSRLCHPDQSTLSSLAEMIEQADDVLFSQALNNNHHVLHTLLHQNQNVNV